MADNTTRKNAAGATETVAAAEAEFSGEQAKVSMDWLVHVAGAEGSRTVAVLSSTIPPGTASACLQVRLPTVTASHTITLATTNAKSIFGSSTYLRSVHIYNNESERIVVKFHNISTVPVPGTTPVVLTLVVQAGLPRDVSFPGHGILFSNGLGISVTRETADADATAVGAGSLVEVTYGG